MPLVYQRRVSLDTCFVVFACRSVYLSIFLHTDKCVPWCEFLKCFLPKIPSWIVKWDASKIISLNLPKESMVSCWIKVFVGIEMMHFLIKQICIWLAYMEDINGGTFPWLVFLKHCCVNDLIWPSRCPEGILKVKTMKLRPCSISDLVQGHTPTLAPISGLAVAVPSFLWRLCMSQERHRCQYDRKAFPLRNGLSCTNLEMRWPGWMCNRY